MSHRFASLASVTVTVLLAGTLAIAASTTNSISGARLVVERLDALTQPRFLQSMGQFGMDRVGFASPDGHPRISLMAGETRSEKRDERAIERMRHPYAIAMLHCTHKPGKLTHADDRSDPRVTGVSPISCASGSDESVDNYSHWADEHLSRLTQPYVSRVKHGEKVDVRTGAWLLSIRPVKATSQTCITCHTGQKRGDTLGAMIYLVRLKPGHQNVSHYFPDGES